MKTRNFSTSACRACRFYQPEGRRGGLCQQLGVPVSSGWKACSLALPPFASSWEKLEGIIWATEEKLTVQNTVCKSDSYLDQPQVQTSETAGISTYKNFSNDTLAV